MALWITLMLIGGLISGIIALMTFGSLYSSIVERRFRIRFTYVIGMLYIVLTIFFFIMTIIGMYFF